MSTTRRMVPSMPVHIHLPRRMIAVGVAVRSRRPSPACASLARLQEKRRRALQQPLSLRGGLHRRSMRLYPVRLAARDEPGALARVTRQLANHRINLQGFVVDSAGIQVLTKDLTQTATALQEGGFRYSATEVHEVILEDRPGSLADLCERLAAVGINIASSFGVATGLQEGGFRYSASEV